MTTADHSSRAAACHVKICGISDQAGLRAAAGGGARYVGFVFVERSPRYIAVDIAKELSISVPTGVKTVGLFSDPSDEDLRRVLPYVMLDAIQLHGRESAARVIDIKAQYGLPVIKAIPIETAADLCAVDDYIEAADMVLLDTAGQKDGAFGGSGQAFDWTILRGWAAPIPWMLAGGLTPENVQEALDLCAALPQFHGVDVSGGVEAEKGVKDPARIAQFLKNCGK